MEGSIQRIGFSSNSARVYVFDNAHGTGSPFTFWACSSGEVLEPSGEETEFAEEKEEKIRENQNKFYVDDGWIYSKELGRTALCWLPPSLRCAIGDEIQIPRQCRHQWFSKSFSGRLRSFMIGVGPRDFRSTSHYDQFSSSSCPSIVDEFIIHGYSL
ncbi:hypothetical protein A0H81_14448 [Grifola frondosa]|uniref:Uncharacterized protein n=1 Tax=Grifola frondosa TaxID=5627 RepID=A0A1C7LS75_GRIFR|nr:hypothetical protein A0H81_14448 [Grifola frondosa]